ncbi:nitrate- and nitrite sensing domain-containing protein [Halomonas sp. DP5N14-9]|uniref:methyl-accepting chemotaxis protein n=1 Tax=Halomonas sp. DP5N14-9 TaxID=2859075 RepID=UPI001C9907A8|nr:methyl-accepting chemotaxis protein [Halomonas sp. DP5N14-9]MBY5940594.1 nitrate- and nitrite sensing domain-containing protein [Halomonas sp. DP5N14-9]
MTSLLDRLTMGRKFFLVLFLPLLSILWMTLSTVLERQAVVTRMDNLQEVAILGRHSANLVHELQRERGMTAAFLSSQGRNYHTELPVQREATNTQAESFDRYIADIDFSHHDPRIEAQVDLAKRLLEEKDDLRRKVDGLDISAEASTDAYTNINEALIDIVAKLTFGVDQGEVARQLTAYYDLLNIKELAGIERAVLAASFSADAISPVMFRKLLSLIVKSDVHKKNFFELSSPRVQEELKTLTDSALGERLNAMRSVVLEKASSGGFGIDHQEWFEAQTEYIDGIQQISRSAEQYLLARIDDLQKASFSYLLKHALVMLAVLLVTLAFSIITARSVVRPLKIALMDISEQKDDLTKRLAVPGKDELSQLYRAFNDSLSNIASLVVNLKKSASAVEAVSGEITRGNQDLASRTEQQAASLIQTASSMEQITATVKQTSDSARQAQEMTREVACRANDLSQTAAQTHTAMEQIRDANQEVTRIVEAIDDIAFQTNILALNASVEAARAGDQGRGFSVVASEVQKLASRCAEEATLIRRLITTSTQRVDKGERLVASTSEALVTISEHAQQTATLVSEISTAATEQSLGIEQITQALAQLEDVTQRNTGLVERVATASESLDKRARDMASLVGRFKVDVPTALHATSEDGLLIGSPQDTLVDCHA